MFFDNRAGGVGSGLIKRLLQDRGLQNLTVPGLGAIMRLKCFLVQKNFAMLLKICIFAVQYRGATICVGIRYFIENQANQIKN